MTYSTVLSRMYTTRQQKTFCIYLRHYLKHRFFNLLGPFVMNTREEINKTLEDYNMCKNGFEKAKTWKSKIGHR